MENVYLIVEKVSPFFEASILEPVLSVEKEEPCMELIKDGNSVVLVVGEQGPPGTGATANATTDVKTVDYTILESDLGVGRTVGMYSTETRTITLPLITESMTDPITLAKLGTGRLNIACNALNYAAFSDQGGTIYNDSSNTWESISLLPAYDYGRWIVLNIVGTWRK